MDNRSMAFLRLFHMMRAPMFRNAVVDASRHRLTQLLDDFCAVHRMTWGRHESGIVITCSETRAAYPACIVISSDASFGSNSAQVKAHMGEVLVQLFEQGANDAVELASEGPRTLNWITIKDRVLFI